MDEIIKTIEEEFNRLLNDFSRKRNWDNEVSCSEAVKNLAIAYNILRKEH